ncbi:hypothetical protein EMPG_15547 [Blastomyces silverae]|uniref:Cytochrome P450 oxidoreductase n=1 Tax=Blastomyces silverae TaxID=2060906 RepID=A0A0H1BIM5_9EURO|nr:hypothetical protein EMPG_15547 [Blastomyces silverae]
MLEASLSSFATYGLGFYLIYIATLLFYRRFFHPLAHIPGPPLAGVTYLYEWYYDLYLGGQFTFNLKGLHKKYGPVVRINPDDVHIDDPDYFGEVYNQSNGRVDKPSRVAEAFGPYPAAIGTVSHELHRIRRSPLNPFFSKKSVNDLFLVMCRPTNILCKRLDEACKTGETINMKYIYAAVTLDIINDYCFASSTENVLKPDFGRKGFDDVDSFFAVSLLNIHIPWLLRLNYSLPVSHRFIFSPSDLYTHLPLQDRVNKFLTPALADVLDFRKDLSRQVENIRDGKDKSYENAGHRTLFHELLESKLPPSELKRDRLREEAFSVVTAGSGTTAQTLRGAAYHIAANRSIRQRLYDELRVAIPDPSDPPSLHKLEQLPYLSAVVKEGLRLCNPVTHRVSRQFPDKSLNCHGYVIPAGSTLGMTAYLTHHNENIYPEPTAFRPERWLEQDKSLERYLVSFSGGPRGCLGKNLARAELFLILALVFRQFDFDVSGVVRERDIDVSRDYMLAAQASDSPGILVKVKKAC